MVERQEEPDHPRDDELDEVFSGPLNRHFWLGTPRSVLRSLVEACVYRRRELAAFLREPPDNHESTGDYCNDVAYELGFTEVAVSQMFIGGICPLIETIFRRAASRWRVAWDTSPLPSAHLRSDLRDGFWDPSVVCQRSKWGPKPRQGFVEGYAQLLDAIGEALPADQDLTELIAALFAYRNKSLHHGYEWPGREGQAFLRLVNDRRWRRWFSEDRHDKGWLISMTDRGISDGLESLDPLAKALVQIERRIVARNGL